MMKLFDEIPYIEGEGIILRALEDKDADALGRLTGNDDVYKYLPTFLFERQYDDMHEVIRNVYGDQFVNKESLILAVCDAADGEFSGLAEFYGYKDSICKISIGYRLPEECWGRGIATRTVAAMVDYLYSVTDIEIITASTMVENKASFRVLEKNDFDLVVSGAEEDWGFDGMTLADKWVR